tara:strand:+ start:741 stop:1040 length:300 start_codon:yes stop_codon:yes gene_type:complete
MIIDMKRPLLDLHGNRHKKADGDLGQYLGEILVNSQGQAVKKFELARKFTQDGQADVDTEDFEMIKKAVTENKAYNNLIIAQILLAMDNGNGQAGKKEQ